MGKISKWTPLALPMSVLSENNFYASNVVTSRYTLSRISLVYYQIVKLFGAWFTFLGFIHGYYACQLRKDFCLPFNEVQNVVRWTIFQCRYSKFLILSCYRKMPRLNPSSWKIASRCRKPKAERGSLYERSSMNKSNRGFCNH